jgi:formiminotetrahydrofolate cyclodeaminase
MLVPQYTVAELIARIGEDTPSPGCGVAAAVTFGLAAACAAKATVISLRHAPDDQRLHQAYEFFRNCAPVALKGAEADRREFAKQIEQRDSTAPARLADVGLTLIETIDKFDAVLAIVAPHVRDNMSGDIFAARALAAAARQVEENNLQGNMAAQP